VARENFIFQEKGLAARLGGRVISCPGKSAWTKKTTSVLPEGGRPYMELNSFIVRKRGGEKPGTGSSFCTSSPRKQRDVGTNVNGSVENTYEDWKDVRNLSGGTLLS